MEYNTRKLLPSEAMIKLASQYIGMQEIIGEQDNQTIVQMFQDIGYGWIKDDETSWCSCFINWLAFKLNCERSGKLDARSWISIGKTELNPRPGDIVVFWRESLTSWKGHVALFLGYSSTGDILCLGGNQSNEVNITIYPKERVLSFRRLVYKNT